MNSTIHKNEEQNAKMKKIIHNSKACSNLFLHLNLLKYSCSFEKKYNLSFYLIDALERYLLSPKKLSLPGK